MASRGTLEVWSEGSLRWPEERVRRAGQMSSEASRLAGRGGQCEGFSGLVCLYR